MAHIHTEPGQIDHTASAFIIRLDTPTPKLLFHVHKKLGILLQTGGHIELNETPWQAIRHEITEETGYDLSQLTLLQPKMRMKSLTNAVLHPQPALFNTHKFDPEGAHRHSDISYVFTTVTEPKNSPDEGESTAFRWLDASDIKALGEKEMFSNVREAAFYILTEVLREWEPVPLSDFEA